MLTMVSLLWLLLIGKGHQLGHWRWTLVLPVLVVWYTWASHTIQSANPISISAPLLGMGLLLLVLLPLEWWFTRQLFQRSLQLLSQYVGPTVLEELSHQDYGQVLEPQLKEVTVLVVDLEGYTQLVTRSSLEEAAQLTKRFLSLMTDVILAYQGTLDKYTGDGLIAFWGAPRTQADDAQQAVRAAVALQTALHPWNEERQAKGLQALTIRVGVATGSALVGDLGTPFRSTYTAVGSCVNLAARLQLAARHQHVKILVDNRTRQKIQGLSFHALGPIDIRGRDLPEHVFSPL
jgi:adenylate cyclase